MQIPDQTQLKQGIKLGILNLLVIAVMAGCGGGGSSVPGNDIVNDDVVVLKKSAGPRKEVCWKEKSRLKEIARQKLEKVRHRKLDCNLITRRALAAKKEILTMR